MYQFAFLMLPEPGHIFPSLRVAKSLVKKGHTVLYISVPALQGYLRKQGFRVHVILRSALSLTDTDLLTASEGTIVQQQLDAYLDTAGKSLAELLAEEIRKLRFDLLVCDSSIIQFCGETLRTVLDIPIVALSSALPDDERKQLPSIPEIVLCPREFDIPGRIWNPTNVACNTFLVGAGMCR